MTVTWEAVGVLACLVACINAAAVYVMKLEINAAVAKNNDTLLTKINGSYLKSELAEVRFEQVLTLIAALDARLRTMEALRNCD